MSSKFIILISSIALWATACKSTAPVVHVIEPTAYATAIADQSVTIIDVRTPEEYAAGHIPGAVNINVQSDTFAQAIQQYNKKKPIYIYCQSGRRSAKASEQMKAMGFKKITDLNGGYKNWKGTTTQ